MKFEYTNKLNLTKDKREKELPFNKIADNKSKYYKVEKVQQILLSFYL